MSLMSNEKIVRTDKILIIGPTKSGKSTLMRSLLPNLGPYAKLIIGDDMVIDDKYWTDEDVAVICTIQHENLINPGIKPYLTMIYRSYPPVLGNKTKVPRFHREPQNVPEDD